MDSHIKSIDNLGRILIPKEIRDKLKIKADDLLDISLNNEIIEIKKYSKLKEIKDINLIANTIYHFIKHNIVITDRDKIISSTNKQIINQNISKKLESSIQRREQIYENNIKPLLLTDNYEIKGYYIINSLIYKSQVIGLIIIYDTKKEITEEENKTLSIIIKFINKYLEE